MAFFRAQEPACRAHAEQVGNPVVDPYGFGCPPEVFVGAADA